MNKWLVLSGDVPYPTYTGGRLPVYNRLRDLKSLGIDVDLICTVKEQPKKEHIRHLEKIVNNLYIFPRDMSIKHVINPITPFQIGSRNNFTKMLKLIANEYKQNNDMPGVIFVEGLYVSKIALEMASYLNITNVIYRAHNWESDYFMELAKSAPLLKKVYLFSEAYKLSRYEPQIVKEFPLILSVSIDELSKYKRCAPSSDIRWFPPNVKIPEVLTNKDDGKTILFLGALDMPNNIYGLRWFIENVWKKFNDISTQYRFLVVGKDPTDEVKKLCENINIELHPNVPDVKVYYEMATGVINPIFHGAGLNIKTIEAIGYGKPLITTSKGLRGTGLSDNKNMFISNTPEEFRRCIHEVMTNREEAIRRAAKTRSFIISNYNSYQQLTELVNGLN